MVSVRATAGRWTGLVTRFPRGGDMGVGARRKRSRERDGGPHGGRSRSWLPSGRLRLAMDDGGLKDMAETTTSDGGGGMATVLHGDSAARGEADADTEVPGSRHVRVEN